MRLDQLQSFACSNQEFLLHALISVPARPAVHQPALGEDNPAAGNIDDRLGIQHRFSQRQYPLPRTSGPDHRRRLLGQLRHRGGSPGRGLDHAQQSEHTSDTFHFDNPLDFSSKTLVKLGPALENPRADIGIWPDQNGTLKIWGFTPSSHEPVKPDFWVQILGPGRVLIMYSGRTIAALTGNQAVFIDPRGIFQTLMPSIAAQAHTNDIKLLNLLRYNAILKIVQQTRAHGKGGIILVVPDNKDWMQSIKLPIKYTGGANFLDMDQRQVQQPSESASLDQVLNLIEDLNLPHQKDWVKAWQQVQQQISRVARLTAVDGAWS